MSIKERMLGLEQMKMKSIHSLISHVSIIPLIQAPTVIIVDGLNKDKI